MSQHLWLYEGVTEYFAQLIRYQGGRLTQQEYLDAMRGKISQGEKFGWSNQVLNRKVAGCVGKEAGMKYAHYFEHYQVLLPLVNQIFEGKHAESVKKYDALDPGKKLIASMIVCARMANLLDTKSKKELEKPLSHVGKFMLEIPPENVLVAVRSQIQIERIVEHDLSEHKDWSKVLVDTAKYLKG
jgi:hypothetical protein